LNETGKENSGQPNGLEQAITLPVKYVMSTIGAVVSIGGFIALVTTKSVRIWVKSHPYPIYLALIVAVLVMAGILDYAYHLRKRIMLPSNHDKKLYRAALERIPLNGTVVGWLKRTQMTEASIADFPADVLGALDLTIKFGQSLPVGFDDPRIAASFEALTTAIASFRQSVDSWTFVAHSRQFKGTAVSSSGTSQPLLASRAADASTEEATALTRSHHDLVRAYDRFIRTAHTRGIDIDG
jgi:hypothetical protein